MALLQDDGGNDSWIQTKPFPNNLDAGFVTWFEDSITAISLEALTPEDKR